MVRSILHWAVLFRVGKLVVKYDGSDHFDPREPKMIDMFENSRKFKSASFKSVTKSLSSSQKNLIVQTLLDLEYNKATGKRIDWNANDFEAADAVKILADYFLSSLDALKNTVPDFEKLFSVVYYQRTVLQGYTSKTTENNYIEKTEEFINTKDTYIESITFIKNAEKFIRKNLDKLKTFKRFVDNVERELDKAGISDSEMNIDIESFRKLYAVDVVNHFAEVQKHAQSIKDVYYKKMVSANQTMNQKYSTLLREGNNSKGRFS